MMEKMNIIHDMRFTKNLTARIDIIPFEEQFKAKFGLIKNFIQFKETLDNAENQSIIELKY